GAPWFSAVAAGDAASTLAPSPSGAQAASSNRFNRTRGRRVGRRIASGDSLLGRRGAGTTAPPPSCVAGTSDLGTRPRLGETGRLRKGGPAFNRRGPRPRHGNAPAPHLSNPSPTPSQSGHGVAVRRALGLPSPGPHHPLAAHGVSTISISPRLHSPMARAPWVAHLLLAVLDIASPRGAANEFDLPVLGDATSGVISLQQEYDLGRAWLRA